jgi:hypothetical protein
MTQSPGGRVAPLVKSETVVFKPYAVYEKTLAVVGPEDSDELWRKVQDLPKLNFTSPLSGFGKFAFGDISNSPDKLPIARDII